MSTAPTTTRCPDCQAPLTGAPACRSCGLQVSGPSAARLWQVDLRLATIDGERDTLLAERERLLILLRGGGAPMTWDDPLGQSTGTAPAPLGVPAWAAPAATAVPGPRPAKETSPKQVQNTLLGLGALLLALAGTVFAAVTYQSLGAVGRALVLLILTGLAVAAPQLLLRRGLSASAEAVASVAVVLAVLDAGALRRAGLAADAELSTYAAVSATVLAAAAAGWAAVMPLRAARLTAVLAAQISVVLLLVRLEVSPVVAALSLTALAAVDLFVAAAGAGRLPAFVTPGRSGSPAGSGDRTGWRLPVDVQVATMVLGAGAAGVALLISLAGLANGDRGAGAALLALAALAVAAATGLPRQREVLTGLAVPLVATAALAVIRPSLTEPQEPLVPVAVALLALQVAALLPRLLRRGPVWGSMAVVLAALLAVAEPVLLALAGPLTWLVNPWTLTGTEARDAVLQGERWTGTVVTLVVLAAAALCTGVAGVALERGRDAAIPSGILLVLSALVLPLGLATSYPVALVLLLGAGIALCAAGLALPGFLRQGAFGVGFATALLAAVWSVADQDATLIVLPVVALLAAALSLRLPLFAGAAALLAGAELAAFGASRDLAPDQVGGLLLLAPAVCVGLSYLLGRLRPALEVAGAILAATCVVLAVGDPGWLSWTLAAAGLLGLAVAIRPDRRVVGLVGGLLLSGSSWVRLADAGVEAPEPYVAPLAAAALLFGYLRRRETPGTSSFAAYGAGLSIALVPSLLKALDDPTPTRGLLLLVVCVGVVLVGVKERLRAPLAVGGTVLVVDALRLLAPYASAVPRWTLLATAGAALVVVGATYEQRLRDVTRIRERYDALG